MVGNIFGKQRYNDELDVTPFGKMHISGISDQEEEEGSDTSVGANTSSNETITCEDSQNLRHRTRRSFNNQRAQHNLRLLEQQYLQGMHDQPYDDDSNDFSNVNTNNSKNGHHVHGKNSYRDSRLIDIYSYSSNIDTNGIYNMNTSIDANRFNRNISLQANGYDSDYANKPPPIPLPGSPSYSYYLMAHGERTNTANDDALANDGLRVSNDNLEMSGEIVGVNENTHKRGSSISSNISNTSSVLQVNTSNGEAVSKKKKGKSLSTDKGKFKNNSMKTLKSMVFAFMNPTQHIMLALCRDIPLWCCLYYMFIYFCEAYRLMSSQSLQPMIFKISNKTREDIMKDYHRILMQNLVTTRSSEYFITGIWCFVSSFIVYSILDGLIVRWIVIYSVHAAIVRMCSISVCIVAFIRVTLLICSPTNLYLLHTWIFISCCFTACYIIQNFFVQDLDNKIIKINNGNQSNDLNPNGLSTNNLNTNSTAQNNKQNSEKNDTITSDAVYAEIRGIPKLIFKFKFILSSLLNGNLLRNRTAQLRTSWKIFNYYNIIIYAVMPIGVASFITMIVLLRNILILKLDIETISKYI